MEEEDFCGVISGAEGSEPSLHANITAVKVAKKASNDTLFKKSYFMFLSSLYIILQNKQKNTKCICFFL
ncbi:MAG: hypothetical protein IKN70_10800 [Fibrobacter sp.]|nr:hypothetical protein [Fibrobacter sp.]MBO7106379.1 hypothetical protein [Fibrobacter sp.]MBR3670476.1 hypothetical protein [Fibrobacter sp.]